MKFVLHLGGEPFAQIGRHFDLSLFLHYKSEPSVVMIFNKFLFYISMMVILSQLGLGVNAAFKGRGGYLTIQLLRIILMADIGIDIGKLASWFYDGVYFNFLPQSSPTI
jgi:hypothetical protein